MFSDSYSIYKLQLTVQGEKPREMTGTVSPTACAGWFKYVRMGTGIWSLRLPVPVTPCRLPVQKAAARSGRGPGVQTDTETVS